MALGRRMYEKDLERWLYSNPEMITGQEELLNHWSQVRCGLGVIDLLFLSYSEHAGPRLSLVELKRGSIKEEGLCQILRYAASIREPLDRQIGHLCSRRPARDHVALHTYAEASLAFWELDGYGRQRIWPILIGSKASDHVWAAATAAGVRLVLYEPLDNGGFQLRWLLDYKETADDRSPPSWRFHTASIFAAEIEHQQSIREEEARWHEEH